MSKTHLQTAHEHGVKAALQKLGYASVDDVNKEMATLGLLEQPKTAAASNAGTDAVLAQLKQKLNG